MNKLDTIRQKIEADRKQDDQRQQELDSINKQISALDAQIDEAIAAGQSGTAEKLLAEQGDLKSKKAVMERISAHKTAPDAYHDELLKICTEEVSVMQAKVDKASADLEKAQMAYLEKKIALSKMLYEAAMFRYECGALAGLGALWANPRFDAFPCVKYHQDELDCTYSEREIITGIDPEFFARFDEINSYDGFKF